MERHLLYKTKKRQEGRFYVVWWVIKKTLSGNVTNLQARAQSCRERRELELVQSKLPHTSASKIFVIFKLAPHKMLKTEKLVLAHFVEVDENRWRVFQSTLVHACLHLFSMLKKKKVFCTYIHANGDVSHNDRKRKGSVNHVIMSVTLARPLKTLTLISSGWTVTAYNRIYIDLGLWCCDWCWLDNFGFFSAGVVRCSLFQC